MIEIKGFEKKWIYITRSLMCIFKCISLAINICQYKYYKAGHIKMFLFRNSAFYKILHNISNCKWVHSSHLKHKHLNGNLIIKFETWTLKWKLKSVICQYKYYIYLDIRFFFRSIAFHKNITQDVKLLVNSLIKLEIKILKLKF